MQQEAIRDPVRAMEDARALLQVANRLEPRLSKPDLHLPFRGRFLACAILLGLAAELALKALIMRDTGCTPKCHELIKLFDRLPEKTKQGLEWQMPGIPGMPHLFPPVGIREPSKPTGICSLSGDTCTNAAVHTPRPVC